MAWPFRRRHKAEDAPGVMEARQDRDDLLEKLDEANQEVDRVHDRVIDDYEDAEQQRLTRRKR